MGYFQEECAKRRNALAAESNRLVSELREMAAAFDDKLQALAKLRLTTAAALHAQELYIASLAMSLQTREYMGARDKDLEDAWMRLVPEEEAAAAAHEAFKLELDYQVCSCFLAVLAMHCARVCVGARMRALPRASATVQRVHARVHARVRVPVPRCAAIEG